ncbi:hypothetical protein MKY84_12665 [Chryseomicrobium sp. FSL W7-1435]|uniref:hypothetical protein n=1 Tax=Chryseomicrobium sp. FSL W7-1435 TaxID=2921704 RepID=UPI003159B6DA
MKRILAVLALLGWMVLPSQAFANYASFFVVYEDFVYELTSESVVEVGEQIGEVTEYGDRVEFYSGNFSNAYEVGTPYFAIPGVDPAEKIAVEESPGVYIVGERSVEFTGEAVRESSLTTESIGSIFSFVVLGLIGFFLFRRLNFRRGKKEVEPEEE